MPAERHMGMEPMQPTVNEIADGIYRISTWIPEVSPEGFTFNQFLVIGEEPLLSILVCGVCSPSWPRRWRR